MPMIRTMRLLNALEAGTMTGAQLQALFAADPSRVGEFQILLDMPGQRRRILSSETTLLALGKTTALWSSFAARTPSLILGMIPLATVIADAFTSALATGVLLNDTFRPAVFANASARAAMAASSLALADLMGSAVKLREVIASQPVLDEIFARPAALTALRASTALVASAVPTMTAASAPAGNAVTASTTVSGSNAYLAFDKAAGTNWASANSSVANQWLRHSTTGVNRYIHRAYIRTGSLANSVPRDFRIEYSQDGTTWFTAASGQLANETSTDRYVDVNCAVAAPHWRLFMVDAYGTGNIYVAELDFFGFVVP